MSGLGDILLDPSITVHDPDIGGRVEARTGPRTMPMAGVPKAIRIAEVQLIAGRRNATIAVT
jgi:hypothetical protein